MPSILYGKSQMNTKTIVLSATMLIVVIAATIFYFANKPTPLRTVGDVCRAYAFAIEAVAEARDNLDQPSWEKLVKLHPVLEKNGQNERAVLFASSISLRLAATKDSPRALKMWVFEQCPETYLCMHRGVCNSK